MGPLFNGVKVKIADDGEILVSGEVVMNGYWNDPEATSKTLIDGWIHTGDIGEFDEDDYLKITDRKKDILVNAGGDNISPSRVEAKLDIEPEISQSMLYGDFKNYLVAVIVPDKDFAINWARKNKSKIQIFNDPKKAILNSDVIFADKFIGLYDKKNKKKKLKDFKNFQVNSNLMKLSKKNSIFLHCLPASRGEEVSAEILDGNQSKVWQQALNRLHVQKSILLYCLDKLR